MVKNFKIDIYADGADLASIKKLNKLKFIDGFTTNPSLMRKSKVKNYKKFALDVLKNVKNKPVSFEVFTDNISEMETQAEIISKWGKNAFVKIPICNTKGKSTHKLIEKLSKKGIKCNITAILTINQIKKIYKFISPKTETILSVFCGRIADTGRDPLPIFHEALKICRGKKNIKLLWASTRETLNIYQAESANGHIITVPYSILEKLPLYKKNLNTLTLETVKTFYKDAKNAKYYI